MDGHTNAVISLLVVNRLMYTGSADGTAKEQQNMVLTKHILSVSLFPSFYLSISVYLSSIYIFLYQYDLSTHLYFSCSLYVIAARSILLPFSNFTPSLLTLSISLIENFI